MLPRQRLTILCITLLIFALFVSWKTWDAIQVSRSTFLAGTPPQDVMKAIVPKQIPLATMRPPAITSTDWIRYGSVTASMSVIEFGDYECEACKQMEPVLQEVISSYNGAVRFIWKDFPVYDRHAHAVDAAAFARCAGEQGKFWEAHDALLSANALSNATFADIAIRLELDTGSLNDCRRDPALIEAIMRDTDVARGDGINTAPLFFIGTKAISGSISTEELDREIKFFLGS